MQNMLRFKNLEERKDWMELFCEDKYENCPYYKAIYQKYEEDQHGNCKQIEETGGKRREKKRINESHV